VFFETFFKKERTYSKEVLEIELPPDTGRQQKVDIESLKRGDRAAFAHFVESYQDMVFACCRTVGLGLEDSEDAASEAFLAAYRAIGKFDGKSKLSSWLWTIAYRNAVDVRAKSKKAASLNEEVIHAAVFPKDRPEQNSLERKEQSDVIWQAVGQLPENWAAAIVLFYREEKSVDEIAQILHSPANTVKTWLDRGRKKLHHSLGIYWKNDYVKL
jgi:RNA polymerase sigma-70 factor (ECF subfamily)